MAEQVVAVIDGADLGTDAKVPILTGAGIATVGTSTLGTTQSLNQDAFFFSPPATTYPAAEVDLAATIGAKKLTLLLPDVPQVPILADIATKQAALNQIEVKVVKFDQAAPDFDASLAAIEADNSDAIATIATDDWCNGIVALGQGHRLHRGTDPGGVHPIRGRGGSEGDRGDLHAGFDLGADEHGLRPGRRQ